jgi:enolase-phosphatase E1
VYPDVPTAFERWRRQGRAIGIFSSGSVLAQKLIFGHTDAGDLTSFLSAYFDTTTGPQKDPKSYQEIATALSLPAAAILFLSDSVAERDAARSAGMQTAMSARPENPPAGAHEHFVIQSFDEVFPSGGMWPRPWAWP